MSRKHAATEVFLSHSNKDHAFAMRVVGVLRRNGLRVWYAPSNLVAADEWHSRIGKALERCDWFLVLLTPDSVKSKWVERELVFALDEPRYHGHILPVLLRPCNVKRLSWTLPGMQRVDFRDPENRDWDKLLQVWGLRYRAGKRTRRP